MDNSESPKPQFEDIVPTLPEINTGIVRQAMDIHIADSEQIEQSPEEYQRESFARAMNKISEIEQYIEQKVVSREEGNKIIAGQWAQTEIQGLIDPVTYSLNRRGFDERLKGAMAHASRAGESISVAYFDLKGFKAVNDQIGHSTGDKVLLYVADFLRTHATQRADDFISRIGGDEFIIGFPMGEEQALRDKLNSAMLDEALPQYIRERMEHDEIAHNDIVVKARVGLSSAQPGDTAESIKHRADTEMNAQRNLNEPSDR